MDQCMLILATSDDWGGWLATYLWTVVSITALELLVFLGPLLLLAAIMHGVSQRVEGAAIRLFGHGRFLQWFSAVGVAVHELGHAAMCVLFRHRVVEIQLFKPDTRTGTLGYVRHAWDTRSPYQRLGRFFIAIGPVFSGTAVIALALHGLLGVQAHDLFAAPDEAPVVTSIPGVLREIASLGVTTVFHLFETLLRPSLIFSLRFWVFLYLALTVGGHITLSRADLDGGQQGLTFLIGLLGIVNAFLLFFVDLPPEAILEGAPRAFPLYSLLVLAIVVNILVLGLLRVTRAFRETSLRS